MPRDLARITAALSGKPWAITREGLDELIALAERRDVSLSALARRRPAREGERGAVLVDDEEELYEDDTVNAYIRDCVAVVPVHGPLVAYASWIERACGVTSYATIRGHVEEALAHEGVESIVLDVDTPGGQVTGCGELAAFLREACSVKAVVAYVGGDCCSAGYWLASACDHIVVSSTSAVGSLGCCGAVVDRRGAEEKAGIKTHEIISSQTPNKRPDVATEAGRAQLQAMIDDTAQVFLEDVAGYRGLSLDVVAGDQFGKGAVFVGQKAVDAGLADEVGSFEEVMAELAVEPEEPGFAGGLSVAGAAPNVVSASHTPARRA